MNPVQVIQQAQDRPPENRKDLYLFWEKQLAQAIDKKQRVSMIRCLVNSLQIAAAELDDTLYRDEDITDCKPDKQKIKKQYIRDNELIVPELIYSLSKVIDKIYLDTWIENLEVERMKIGKLLKTETKWLFSGEKVEAPTM